jgi:hypothetical protein
MVEDSPLIERVGQRERVALASFHRYFVWADDMRLQYRNLLRNTPIGRLKQAGGTEEEALKRVMSDPGIRGSLLAAYYAFPYMSYYYGGMYAIIEAWTKRLKYRDPEIDGLLQSPFVARLERHRHAAFHFTPEYFDVRLLEFVNEPDSEAWLNQVHAAFTRWFRYHLKLGPLEPPRATEI